MRLLRTSWWLGVQLALVLTVGLLGLLAAVTVVEPTRLGPDVLRLVGSAGQTAAAAGSYRMELSFTLDGLGAQVEVAGTAELDAASGDSTGRIGLPGGGELAFLTTGGRGYFELPAASPLRLGKAVGRFPAAGAAGAHRRPAGLPGPDRRGRRGARGR